MLASGGGSVQVRKAKSQRCYASGKGGEELKAEGGMKTALLVGHFCHKTKRRKKDLRGAVAVQR